MEITFKFPEIPQIPGLVQLAQILKNEGFFNFFCLLSVVFALFQFYRSFSQPLLHGRLFDQSKVKWFSIRSGLAFAIINLVPLAIFIYFVLIYSQMTAAMSPLNVPTVAYILFRLYRGVVYPFRRSHWSKPWPIDVVLYYLGVNSLLALIQARTVMFEYWGFGGAYIYLLSIVYLIALYYNITTDWIMCSKRCSKGRGYKVMKGGIFNKVTQPNYGSEIIIWVSWTLSCSFSLGTVAIFAWLLPLFVSRSRILHMWNKKFFTNYKVQTNPLFPHVYFQPKKGEFGGIFDFMILE